MNREKQKELIKEAMAEFFASTEGETIIGTIVCKALYQNLNSYEFEMEHTAPDGVKEAKIVKGDILKFIAQWIKNSEGAIRGAQADAAKARNRAGQALAVIQALAEAATAQPELIPVKLPRSNTPAALEGACDQQTERIEASGEQTFQT